MGFVSVVTAGTVGSVDSFAVTVGVSVGTMDSVTDSLAVTVGSFTDFVAVTVGTVGSVGSVTDYVPVFEVETNKFVNYGWYYCTNRSFSTASNPTFCQRKRTC